MKPVEGCFLSIGAGKNQIPLILAAKSRGLHVVGVDRNSNAPGFSHCDVRILESTKEYRKIHHAMAFVPFTHTLKGVGSRSFGDAIHSTAYLADKYKLPGNSPESVALFSNKKKIKSLLEKNGVLVPKTISLPSTKQTVTKVEPLPFPIIVKPFDGFGKKGIKVIFDEGEWKTWSKGIKASEWVIEPKIEGDEITVLGMVVAKRFHLISLTDKITTAEPPFIEIAHITPSKRSEMAGEIKMICQSLVNITGLKNGPLVAEFKINEFGDCFLLEAAPEVGGEFLADRLLAEAFSYPYFKDLLSLYIGEKPKPQFLLKHQTKGTMSAILFRNPNKKIKIAREEKPFPILDGESIFMRNELLAPGIKLEGLEGNFKRTYVYGISTSKKQNQAEWVDSLLSRISE